jgi:hypothetical protein
MPVVTPAGVIVATLVSELVHMPPGVAVGLVKVIAAPMHTLSGPIIAPENGLVLTVSGKVAIAVPQTVVTE